MVQSLFEDNAEFGLGFRLTIDKHTEMARELLTKLSNILGGTSLLISCAPINPTRRESTTSA